MVILYRSYVLTEECGSDTELNIIVTSRRNLTGHWITSFEAERTEPTGATKEISMNVTQTTSTCQGKDTYKLRSTAIVSNYAFKPPADYELVDELYFYKYPAVAMSWHEAKKFCEDDGTNLLIINSEDEAQSVKRYRDRKPKLPGPPGIFDTWVGITDEEKEGEYKTIFGQPLSSTGYPKRHSSHAGGPSRNCVFLSTWEGSVGLADTACANKLPFICEFDVHLRPSSQ
ncbi:hemolymph lipopolysaccharide-binding protein [Anabrus simplex]|uniref:hemolymph lipopolysaccharide-binding protein n=1 Tax=Anabrus simplex TaxID=316456 RepID=UPI0035A3627B